MTAQLPAENESSRDKLLQRQAELTAQLKEAQIALYSEDEPEVLAERTRLQISAAQYQQQWQHSQAQYEQTTHELAQYDKDREQIFAGCDSAARLFSHSKQTRIVISKNKWLHSTLLPIYAPYFLQSR